MSGLVVPSFLMIAFVGGTVGQAAATDPPPPLPQADKTPAPVDAVIVNALTTNISTRIDRQIYSLRDDPQLQASPLIDVLAKLPSVTLTANGELTLLGVPGVTVLVDGKPVPDVRSLLRSPGGSRIDRVEILTNPPAEFAADGVGGVINIITHHSFIDGLSGTIDANANTLGSSDISLSPNWSAGRWAVSGSARLTADRPESRSIRTRELLGGGQGAGASIQLSKMKSNFRGGAVQPQFVFSASDQVKVAFGGESSRSRGRQATNTEVDAADASLSRQEQTKQKTRFDIDSANLGYERAGPKEGERFTTDLTWSRLASDTDLLITQHFKSREAATSITNRTANEDAALSAKYERPIGPDASLSTGMGFEHAGRSVRQSLTALAGEPIGMPDFEDMSGWRNVASAYGSAQAKFGAWTVLPGIRFERETYAVSTGGPRASGGRSDIFPSLFLRRALGKAVNLNISYSARISRPDITAFDPQIVYSSATQASTGNPNLKPEQIDSFEARVEYKRNGSVLNMTSYRRLSRNVLAQDYRVLDGGVTVSMPVNAGKQDSWGIDLNVQRRLSSRVKATVAGNVYNRTLDQAGFGPLGGNWWGYAGSLQLEYKAPPRKQREGDTYLLTARYVGPIETPQTRSDGFFKVDATWRHPLSAKATLVVTVSDLFNSVRYRKVIASGVAREKVESWNPAPLLRIAVSRQFGRDD